jgi:hypothetical protein
VQAAGGIISASILSTPGASKFYKGGLTVCVSSFAIYFLNGSGLGIISEHQCVTSLTGHLLTNDILPEKLYLLNSFE